MKQLSVMVKPASSLCNMRCRYCFYTDVSHMRSTESYGIMSIETAKAVIANVWRDLEDGDEITIAFQGGEPLLAGLDFFRFFAEEALRQPVKANISWALQTNGALIDDDWCAFFKAHGFLVGLSLDGDSELHNQNRRFASGNGTFKRVMQAKRLMDINKVEYNILSVLTNESARHPQRFWSFMLKEKIHYVQFIPCLGALGREPGSDAAPLSTASSRPGASSRPDAASRQDASYLTLTPKRFYSFYSGLFPLWQKEAAGGNYISVRLFDDIVNLFVGERVTSCGLTGVCHPQYIIEADGGVYPCDFYVLDEFRAGSMTEIGMREAFDRMAAGGFLQDKPALPDSCAGCGYLKACNGGCKRMRGAIYDDGNGFCGYRAFLDENLDALCRTGIMLMRSAGRK